MLTEFIQKKKSGKHYIISIITAAVLPVGMELLLICSFKVSDALLSYFLSTNMLSVILVISKMYCFLTKKTALQKSLLQHPIYADSYVFHDELRVGKWKHAAFNVPNPKHTRNLSQH